MKYLNTLGDERELGYCAFCGGPTGTRDHCPSRVLLDEPYPDNLPVVPSCSPCNSLFSLDQEYFACLLECVLVGTTDPSKIRRLKIQRILSSKPALRSRIEQSQVVEGETKSFRIEDKRVKSVLTKLAQGHALYELHQPCPRSPDGFFLSPLHLLSDRELEEFEHPKIGSLLPEVGSRAMQRLVCSGTGGSPWIMVQEGLYRFHASPLEDGIQIQIVLAEYLACQVFLNHSTSIYL